MAGTPEQASLPFWAKCAGCMHCWVAAYYPLELRTFAKIAKRAVCPKCGGKAMIARQDSGRLLEEGAAA